MTTDTDMVERIAEAIDRATAAAGTPYCSKRQARAALEAMKEPTDDMRMAAAHLKGVIAANRMVKPNSADIWKAMIDAALDTEGTK